jgi:hypothetical protein
VTSGIIDVYDSEIGDLTKTNLVVDERSAIRLWYSLGLKVVWSNTLKPVLGASLEVRDNTWSIIGINIIDDANGVMFSNLNSVTVDYLGIITRNPYIASVEFRGLYREVEINVTKRMDMTIFLIDDVAPRLSIETPRDGTMQRSHTIFIKGGAYDMHSGIDRIEASAGGYFWKTATGRSVYECTLTDVPDGLNTVIVRAYDSSGNYMEETVTVLIDSTPPVLNIVSPAQGTRTRNPSIEIVATTDVGASAFIDGVQVATDYTLISHFVTLVEGNNAIKVTVSDLLGNENEAIIDIFLDTEAPSIALLSPRNGATLNVDDVRLLGATDADGSTVRLGTMTILVGRDGTFSVEVGLEPGINHIELVASDDVGNERHLPVVLTYDNVPPWIKLVEPVAQVIYKAKEINVTGYVKEGTRVFVDGREIEVVLGQFRTVITLPEGTNEIAVLAIDEAGNELSVTVPILIDITPPGLTISSPADGLVTNVRTLRIDGMVTTPDNPKSLTLTINGAPFPVGLDRTISQVLELVDGVNVITIEVVDLGGNMATITRKVTLDASAPYLSFGLENTRVDPLYTDPVSLGTFVYVTGYSEVGASVTINGAFVQVDPVTGKFNYTMFLPAPQVGYMVSRTLIHVVSTDAAGNTAAQDSWVNRVEEQKVQEKKIGDNNGWVVFALALIILGLALVLAVWYVNYGPMAEDEDVREDDMVEPEAETHTSKGPAEGDEEVK